MRIISASTFSKPEGITPEEGADPPYFTRIDLFVMQGQTALYVSKELRLENGNHVDLAILK